MDHDNNIFRQQALFFNSDDDDDEDEVSMELEKEDEMEWNEDPSQGLPPSQTTREYELLDDPWKDQRGTLPFQSSSKDVVLFQQNEASAIHNTVSKESRQPRKTMKATRGNFFKKVAIKNGSKKMIVELREEIELKEIRFQAFENATILREQAFEKRIAQMEEEARTTLARYEKVIAEKDLQMSSLLQKSSRSPANSNKRDTPRTVNNPSKNVDMATEPLHVRRPIIDEDISMDPPSPMPHTARNNHPTIFQRSVPSLNQIREKRKSNQATSRVVLKKAKPINESDDDDEGDGDDEDDEVSESESDDDDDDDDDEAISTKKIKKVVLEAVQDALNGQGSGKKKKNDVEGRKRDKVAKEASDTTKHQRRVFCEYIRQLFQRVFKLETDEEFAMHEPAPSDDINHFNAIVTEDGENVGGPNIEDLRIDMRGKISSAWNKAVADILLRQLRITQTNEPEMWYGLPERSDGYFLKMIMKKIERGRHVWRKTQPKIKKSGQIETNREREDRIIKDKVKQGRYSRPLSRRKKRYSRRVEIIKGVIRAKMEEDDNEDASDLPIWKWLLKMIKSLGEDGMSSDESDIDHDLGMEVLHVKKLPWRRNIEKELEVIDKQRLEEWDIYSRRGAKPTRRVRNVKDISSERNPVRQLQRPFYEKAWLERKSKKYVAKLEISEKRFDWIKL